jgi:hypothetical protein
MSRAMARPMPVAPPVRSTTRSFRVGMRPRLLVLFAADTGDRGAAKSANV